jgi:ATP phosphoribosyltransferase
MTYRNSRATLACRAQDLAGKRIVTSFPNVAAKYFSTVAPDVQTHINYVSGSVEVACALGLADGIGAWPATVAQSSASLLCCTR